MVKMVNFVLGILSLFFFFKIDTYALMWKHF